MLPASVSRGEVEALLRGLVPSSRQAFIVDLGSVLQWAQELHSSLSRQATPGASRTESEEQTEGSPPIRMQASLAAAAQYIFRLAVGAQALQLAMCMSVLLQLAGVFPAMLAAGKHQEDTVVSRLPVRVPSAACHAALVPVQVCAAGVGPHQEAQRWGELCQSRSIKDPSGADVPQHRLHRAVTLALCWWQQ